MQILSWGVGRGGQEYKETNLKSSNAQEGGNIEAWNRSTHNDRPISSDVILSIIS